MAAIFANVNKTKLIQEVQKILSYITYKTGLTFLKSRTISGGDIGAAHKLQTKSAVFFLKIYSGPHAKAMTDAEITGLRTIADTNTIKTPNLVHSDRFEQSAYLLMEFIEPKRPDANDYAKLGKKLGLLHRTPQDFFGFKNDNFIGRLPQPNVQADNWATFYATERLGKQLQLSESKGLLRAEEVPNSALLIQVLKRYTLNIKPALLHGDLWGGNYIIGTTGEPYLIDPAVYYGHSEVDVAMTRLFGGFSPDFYQAYHSIVPKSKHYDACMDLYQLYYLLVHLNLFGRSYYGQVKRLLERYF